VLQWNACGIRPHVGELRNYLSKLDVLPDAICLAETFLKPEQSFSLQSYSVERRDRVDGAKGGVAMLIRSDLSYSVCDIDFVNVECMVVNVYKGDTKFCICNVNDSPAKPGGDEGDYKKIFESCSGNVVVTGDFNAHNPWWASSKLDRRGSCLEELCEEHGFTLCNTGETTFVTHQGGGTVLDLTFVSDRLASLCLWDVLDDTWGSDHRPTFLLIGEESFDEPGDLNQNINPPRWNLKKANWPAYKAELVEASRDIHLGDDIDKNLNIIKNAINNAANSAIPLKRLPRLNVRPLPYWNETCSDAIAKRNKLRNKAFRKKTEESNQAYRKQRGITQAILKKEQVNCWQEFCNTLDGQTKMNTVWGMARKMSGKKANFGIPVLK